MKTSAKYFGVVVRP